MSSDNHSGLIEAIFFVVPEIAALALCIWLHSDSLWIVVVILSGGAFVGAAAHILWQRWRKVRPEKLKDIDTAIKAYRAGSDEHSDRRKWAATKALQRIAARGMDQLNRERIAVFASAELENEVRKQPFHGRYNSPASDLVDLLAIANPAWEDGFLESLLGTPGDEVARERLAEIRRTPISDADRQYVREALTRFEESGLRIKPHLDRELIVVRALLQSDLWRYLDNNPLEWGKKIAPDPLTKLFVVLAGEADGLRDIEEIGYYRVDTEPLRSMRAEASKNPHFPEEYSPSIFENAAEIWIINEGNGLEQALVEIIALSGEVMSLTRDYDLYSGELKIASGSTILTLIGGRKRPDLSSFYDILNQAASAQGYQYVFPNPGASSESELIACIALSKLDAFRIYQSLN